MKGLAVLAVATGAAVIAFKIQERKVEAGVGDLLKTFIEFKKQDCTNGLNTITLKLNTLQSSPITSDKLTPANRNGAGIALDSQDKIAQAAANECYVEPDCGGFVYFLQDMQGKTFKTPAGTLTRDVAAGEVYFLRSDASCTQIDPATNKTSCVRASHCVEDATETTYIQKDIITVDEAMMGQADTVTVTGTTAATPSGNSTSL
ncbi:unnamed protein product [Amoebophrya sp. A25]|nr:unnamed protein product [Amoebophrya sp. A25]|eukprot:GSA25T00004844001.1